jgi:hypothetical protein
MLALGQGRNSFEGARQIFIGREGVDEQEILFCCDAEAVEDGLIRRNSCDMPRSRSEC